MVAQNFITTFALTLLLGTNASPLFRRSQQDGRGNIGSVARDDSTNFDTENFGDVLNNGIGNTARTVAGAAGVGNGIFTRRSQVNSQGNIGSVNRDDSFNFVSKIFGDSKNNGVANVDDSTASATGVANGFWKRSQVNSQGNIGSVVRDDSFNFQSKNFGDVVNNGVGNIVETAADATGVSNAVLTRRSQVNSQGNIGSVVRDDSFNFKSKNFGDAVNNGVGNAVETVADATGVSNGVFTRRSQVNGEGNIGSVLRDGSSNFKTENLGNAANNGLFNTILDNAALSGVGNQSFRRRAQVSGTSHVLSSDNDKSNNIHQSFQGDATNNGWGNTLTADSESTGVSSVPPFVRRSIISEDSSKNLIVNDKSARFAKVAENDSINQAAVGVNSRPFWWKRSIVDQDSSKNLVVNDKSTKVLNFEENDSLNQAAVGVNPRPFWWKRSLVDEDSSKNVVINDKSTRVAKVAEDNSVNQATQGVASSPFWKRSIGTKDSSSSVVLNDKSFTGATLAEDNSLNQFSQNGFVHPFFVKRTIFDSDSSDNVVFNDKSFKSAQLTENASVNQALLNGFW